MNFYKNKNILITGGLGFLGSNLANKLVELDANVSIIDNLNPLYGGNLYNVKNIKDKVAIYIDNARNEEIMFPLVSEADIIFHFAAQVSYIDSLSYPYKDFDLNAKMTLEILELCRKHNPKAKIIFSSSRMVLGKITTEKMTEQTPANPLSLYGIHKLTSEKYLQMYFKDFGINSTIFRITNPYGKLQQIKHNKYSLVGWFVKEAMLGNTIKIFGNGEQYRDYIYADDIINAFLATVSNPKSNGEIINLGSGTSTKFKDMVETVVKIVGNGKVEYVPWPKDYENIETGDVITDVSKLKSLSNWKPEYTINEGIQETFNYYKNNILRYINVNK